MSKRYEKLIGNEVQFPIEHRILNILLLLGIVLAIASSIANYLIGIDIKVTAVCVLMLAALIGYYYISIVKKKYKLVTFLAIFTCTFILTPLIWIFNGGLLSGVPYDVILFSSTFALLLNGFRRIAAIGSQICVILLLIILDYNYHSIIIDYKSDLVRYVDMSSNLIIILITNATGFALFMNYYIKEQQKSKEFLIQIEKQKMDSALNRLERLNLIGEMAASIGHEIRNPLTTVRGYLQFFQYKEMYSQHREQFKTMIEELDRANVIITEFLSLAKNKVVEFEIGNLNDSINALLPLIRADAIHTGHEIEVDLGHIPNIKLDRKEIRQLLLNLIRNGLEATPPGKKVMIKTNLIDGKVVLSIQDTGSGIPKEIMDKLGTPFVTTKDTGTGLGLPVCYRIIERHDASIEVDTGAMGTIFYVKFNPC